MHEGSSKAAARRRWSASLVLWPFALSWGAVQRATAATPGPIPPLLPFATPAEPGMDPAGHLVSEKFDGVRAVWDGQVLRFRSGHVVHAPGWFLARLPAQPLDGELWLARGQFEALSGIVRREQPRDDEWRRVRYMVFDLPGAPGGFSQRAQQLREAVARVGWSALVAAEQRPLADAAALQSWLDEVVRGGGEGLVLHRADALWQAGRSEALRKLKPLDDSEAVVVGHEPGKGRHAGRLGALRVRGGDGTEFLIGTGFSDAQRADPPPLGASVTFAHRGVTRKGVPRFASFLRLHTAF